MKSRILLTSILAVAAFYAADVAGAEVTFPVGSVITVTEDGITVRYDEVAETVVVQEAVIADDTPPVVDEFGYCVGLDAVTVCDPAENLDNIYDYGGEVSYWTPVNGVLSLPFTTGTKQHTGLFQMTSGERRRDQFSELIFHGWFSLEPNGEAIEGANCDYWSARVQQNHYWTQEMRYESEACRLPDDSLVYYNARLECHPDFYAGCSPDLYSADRYQFDLAKRGIRR